MEEADTKKTSKLKARLDSPQITKRSYQAQKNAILPGAGRQRGTAPKGRTAGKIGGIVAVLVVIAIAYFFLGPMLSKNASPFLGSQGSGSQGVKPTITGYLSAPTMMNYTNIKEALFEKGFSLSIGPATSYYAWHSNFTIPSGATGISITGAYSSTGPVEAAILSAPQYSAFHSNHLGIANNNTYYYGNAQGATIDTLNASLAPGTYAFEFYDAGTSGTDNVTVTSPMVVKFSVYSYTGSYVGQGVSLSLIANAVSSYSDAHITGNLTGFHTDDPRYSCLDGSTLNVWTAQKEHAGVLVVDNSRQASQCKRINATFTLSQGTLGNGTRGGSTTPTGISLCPMGYVYGADYQCHFQCGDANHYCASNSTCYQNQCLECPYGYYLSTDSFCYPYAANVTETSNASSTAGTTSVSGAGGMTLYGNSTFCINSIFGYAPECGTDWNATAYVASDGELTGPVLFGKITGSSFIGYANISVGHIANFTGTYSGGVLRAQNVTNSTSWAFTLYSNRDRVPKVLPPASELIGIWKTSSPAEFYYKCDFEYNGTMSVVSEEERTMTWNITRTGNSSHVNVMASFVSFNTRRLNPNGICSIDVPPEGFTGIISGSTLTLYSTRFSSIITQNPVAGVFTWNTHNMTGTWTDNTTSVYTQETYTNLGALSLFRSG